MILKGFPENKSVPENKGDRRAYVGQRSSVVTTETSHERLKYGLRNYLSIEE